METQGETSELTQLVSDETETNDEDVGHDYNLNEEKVMSPVRSNKMSSSGTTSHSSVTRSAGRANQCLLTTNSSGSKLFYVNEKRFNRDYNKSSTVRPINPHKESNNTSAKHHCFLSEVPDVRHMEQSLLGLLADFHSGKLRAFGSGTTMDQMKNIREQQEKLAKLHFDLGASTDTPLSDDGLQHSRNTMSQLIDRLEQLSVSIEGLHTNNN